MTYDDFQPKNEESLDRGSDFGDQPQVLTPGILLGRYRLEKQVGRGGMGVVWKAFDEVGECNVALKFVPRDVQRFEREMMRVRETWKLIHNLAHPSICPTPALEQDHIFGFYIVMRWLDGQTLDELLLQNGMNQPLPESWILPILRQVAAALDYAHSRKILHRDVKPSNIFVRIEENQVQEVQLIDFGLASEIRESMTRVSQVQYDTSGTRSYMPPEQWRGRKQDEKTDQYALGVVAYELYSGILPFSGSDVETLRLSILNDPPEPIPHVSDSVNMALQKVLSKDRIDRFNSCTDFVNALAGLATTVTPPAKPSPSKSLIPEISEEVAHNSDFKQLKVFGKSLIRLLKTLGKSLIHLSETLGKFLAWSVGTFACAVAGCCCIDIFPSYSLSLLILAFSSVVGFMALVSGKRQTGTNPGWRFCLLSSLFQFCFGMVGLLSANWLCTMSYEGLYATVFISPVFALLGLFSIRFGLWHQKYKLLLVSLCTIMGVFVGGFFGRFAVSLFSMPEPWMLLMYLLFALSFAILGFLESVQNAFLKWLRNRLTPGQPFIVWKPVFIVCAVLVVCAFVNQSIYLHNVKQINGYDGYWCYVYNKTINSDWDLKQIENAKNLKLLDLRFCDNITDEGVLRLRVALPSCYISE